MNGIPLTKSEINIIIKLRQRGYSMTEIMKEINRGSSTVYRYIKNVKILPKYLDILKSKQGGSMSRSLRNWNVAKDRARSIIANIPTLEQRMYLLSGIYWGEGDKRELSLINSDPQLVRCFIECLGDIGVSKDMLKISLRLFENIDAGEAVKFWSDVLSVNARDVRIGEIIKSNKIGKLKYGMCRVRVAKSSRYFKLLMSIINEIKAKL